MTFSPSWASLRRHASPPWFSQAKFGIFTHWGPYSVAAAFNEWYPRNMYLPHMPEFLAHQKAWGDQKKFGYKDFIPRFTAKRWDPHAWATLFKESGARYVVPVAEHHDSFAMYASSHTRWNSLAMGPKRDVLGELGDALRAQGLKVGASSHLAFNWWYFAKNSHFDTSAPAWADLYGGIHDVQRRIQKLPKRLHWDHFRGARPSPEFLRLWWLRTTEIIDRYRPDTLYFDWCWGQPDWDRLRPRLAAYYYNQAQAWGNEVVLAYKEQAFPKGVATADIERGAMAGISKDPWQADTSISTRSWSHIRDDHFKSPTSLIHTLCDVVSKNGNLLLNVGPRADGVIPAQARDILLEIGAWLKANGEAIYGTKPWHRFGEGPGVSFAGAEHLAPTPTAEDVRYTRKGDSLYAIILGTPGVSLKLHALGRQAMQGQSIKGIRALLDKAPLRWAQAQGFTRVDLPKRPRFKHALTLKIALASLLALALGLPSAAAAAAESSITVDAGTALRSIPSELFGQNWNCYEKSGDGMDPAYNAAVKAMGAKQMRVPGGGFASMRAWDDMTCGGKDASWILDLQQMIRFAKATGTELQPIVNFGGKWCDQEHGYDAAIQKAAAWVSYMNVSPAASPSRYWEIGNETYFSGDASHATGAVYGAQFARFAKAMKAADPTIKLGFNIYENRDKDKLPWNLEALKALKATGVMPDFWVVHSYPVWLPKEARSASGAPSWNKDWYADSPRVDAQILKNVDLMERDTKEMDQTLGEVFGPGIQGTIPYWMTEFRSSLELKFVEYIDAMYCAQVLLEMGRLGWHGANIWALKNGYEEKTQADFGMLRSGSKPGAEDDMPKDSPRPAYYIYPFLSRFFGRNLVSVQNVGQGVLRAWASKDVQGNLTLFLVNNDLRGTKAIANIHLAHFDPLGKAEAWYLAPSGTTVHGDRQPLCRLRDLSVNGVRRPDPLSLPGAPRMLDASASFQVEVPPLNMLLLKLRPKP